MITVSLALIVRNEEHGLREILPRVALDVFDDYFAIDGHSTDGTLAVLESYGVRVYEQKQRGLGDAMIEAREQMTTDALIFFHPDGNEDPSDLPRMVGLLRDGKQFVVASRMIAGSVNEDDYKLLRWRKWANRGFALFANLFFARDGNRTTDVTNGFRGITAEAWDQMNVTSRDLTMDYQMAIRALKREFRLRSSPLAKAAESKAQQTLRACRRVSPS